MITTLKAYTEKIVIIFYFSHSFLYNIRIQRFAQIHPFD